MTDSNPMPAFTRYPAVPARLRRIVLAWLTLALLATANVPALASNAPDRTRSASMAQTPTSAYPLVEHAFEHLGVRYRRGGTSPESGLDCSGLVQRVFRNAAGIELPRTAREMSRLGLKVDRNALQPGDLVFFNTRRNAYSHVGIYIGEGRFVHAPSSGGVVRVEEIRQKYWATRFNGARRIVS
jgi:cell wall-associated NlpC family hydrolase